MRPPVDHGDEMSWYATLSDAEADAVLAGAGPAPAGDLALVSAFVEELRSLAHGDVPAPSRELASLLAGGPPATKPAPVVPIHQPRRRMARAVARMAGAGLAAQAALGVSAAAAAVTAAGAAGVLPGLAQDAVAGLVRVATPFHFPDGAGDDTPRGQPAGRVGVGADDRARPTPHIPAEQPAAPGAAIGSGAGAAPGPSATPRPTANPAPDAPPSGPAAGPAPGGGHRPGGAPPGLDADAPPGPPAAAQPGPPPWAGRPEAPGSQGHGGGHPAGPPGRGRS